MSIAMRLSMLSEAMNKVGPRVSQTRVTLFILGASRFHEDRCGRSVQGKCDRGTAQQSWLI
jgi:hypothetical protein